MKTCTPGGEIPAVLDTLEHAWSPPQAQGQVCLPMCVRRFAIGHSPVGRSPVACRLVYPGSAAVVAQTGDGRAAAVLQLHGACR